MTELFNERMNGRTYKLMNKRINEQINERGSEWMNE